jgi:hypothetical protein
MGRPGNGVTPDRSTIRQSLAFSLTHQLVHRYGAGAPPRLGQGHPSSADAPLRPSLDQARPALAEGQGCGYPCTLLQTSVLEVTL